MLVVLLLSQAILFATTDSYAEDKKVNLNIPHTYNLLIDIGYYKKKLKTSDKEKVVLSAIIAEEEAKVENLFEQNRICGENYIIKEKQADLWKKKYKECTEELIKAKDWPWWKFDLKSVLTGSIGTLLAIIVF